MADQAAWWIVGPQGQVERFPTRQAARLASSARGPGWRARGEYRHRVAPKLAAGIPLAQARGHPPGEVRHVRAHRVRSGFAVRDQELAGLEGSTEPLTIAKARRALAQYRKRTGNRLVSVNMHGQPYRDQPGVVRWYGVVRPVSDLDAQLERAQQAGFEYLAQVPLAGVGSSWLSIDTVAFAPAGVSPR